ncbi:MAG: GNAT family N-acetyltransferase [Clostridia bacterium]|nr:GNAT family N-acetyltransferase [Clostridia bacterium]
MNITYKIIKDLPNEQLYKLFVAVGWADEESTTQTMIDKFNKPFLNSTIVISAWDDGVLVGCVRVLSDLMFRSVIYDLAVLPEYQGNGIGKELVRRCREQVSNSEWLVGTTTERASFYENIGFKLCDDVFFNVPCKWC